MYTPEALLDLHSRSHQNLRELLEHCRGFSEEELGREIEGFGYASIRLQLHHEISAQKYWIGVLEGRMDVDEDEDQYKTIDSLEAFRREVHALTESYLRVATYDQLNSTRAVLTWGNREQVLMPAHVFLRTLAHLYHHQGQILAMCRLLGKPGGGLDFPIL